MTPPVLPVAAARLLHTAAVCGMRSPDRAIAGLRAALTGLLADLELGVQVQGLILLAELLVRAGQLQLAAAVYESTAAQATGLPEQAPALAVMIAGLRADLALLGGDRAAIGVCHRYGQLCTGHAQQARATTAQAMRAVALFQHEGCMRGRAELAALATRRNARPLQTMLDAALAEMRSTCTGGPATPALTLVPPPLAGLVLHRPAASPWPVYLAWRVRVQPGRHDHNGTNTHVKSGFPAVAP